MLTNREELMIEQERLTFEQRKYALEQELNKQLKLNKKLDPEDKNIQDELAHDYFNRHLKLEDKRLALKIEFNKQLELNKQLDDADTKKTHDERARRKLIRDLRDLKTELEIIKDGNEKRIRFDCRKDFADSRPRIDSRFIPAPPKLTKQYQFYYLDDGIAHSVPANFPISKKKGIRFTKINKKTVQLMPVNGRGRPREQPTSRHLLADAVAPAPAPKRNKKDHEDGFSSSSVVLSHFYENIKKDLESKKSSEPKKPLHRIAPLTAPDYLNLNSPDNGDLLSSGFNNQNDCEDYLLPSESSELKYVFYDHPVVPTTPLWNEDLKSFDIDACINLMMFASGTPKNTSYEDKPYQEVNNKPKL